MISADDMQTCLGHWLPLRWSMLENVDFVINTYVENPLHEVKRTVIRALEEIDNDI